MDWGNIWFGVLLPEKIKKYANIRQRQVNTKIKRKSEIPLTEDPDPETVPLLL